MVNTMVILVTANVITSTILNPYPKAQLCKYELNAHLQKTRQSVKIRIGRFWKFGCRLWPWTSAVLKGSLIIGGLKLTIAKDTNCTLKKQAPWRFF